MQEKVPQITEIEPRNTSPSFPDSAIQRSLPYMTLKKDESNELVISVTMVKTLGVVIFTSRAQGFICESWALFPVENLTLGSTVNTEQLANSP